MAFYKDARGKSRQEKKTIAESRGGFKDEGSEYRRSGGTSSSFGSTSGGGSYGRKPAGSGFGGGRPSEGGRSSFGSNSPRPQGGGYGRPSTGEGSSRPQGGFGGGHSSEGGRSSFGSNSPRPQGGGYGRPSTGEGSSRPQGGFGGGHSSEGGRSGFGSNSSRPQGGGYGRPSFSSRPQGNDGRSSSGNTSSGEGGDRPTSFRETTRATPRGERPPMERNDPRGNRKSGNYRFATTEQSSYAERGNAIAPRSYDEQRRARSEDDNRYDRFRYDQPAQYSAPAQYDAPTEDGEGDIVPNENLLSGRNPIREALKSGRDIEKLLVSRGELSGSAREIVQMARERHIIVQEVDRVRLDAITHNHQGMLAFASAYQYSTVEAMLELAKSRGQEPFLVLLDGITDPHNLGAIIRTAECAGAHGVIVQERRAVGLTPAAVKASAGAVEHLPVARVTNLTATIETLKAQNIWIYAADMDGESYDRVDFGGAIALVIGAEGEGVSRLVFEACDKHVSLPLRGQIDSLNASVAAGILLYAAMRAR